MMHQEVGKGSFCVYLKATGAMILISLSLWELFVLGWERGCGEKQWGNVLILEEGIMFL